jgi:Domain of unknown function (DUF4351)
LCQAVRAERELKLVLRLLNKQVGNISTELQNRIKALPSEQLEALGEALLDFTQLADLENWLNQN